MGLQTSVQALEKHVQDLKAHIKQEVATIPKVGAGFSTCRWRAAALADFGHTGTC